MPNPQTAKHQDRFEVANAQAVVKVGTKDLPLFCPGPKAALWASHPRVFLPIEDAADGTYLCPYCGTRYVLERS